MAESVGRGAGFLHVPHPSAADPQRLQSNWKEVERVVNGIVPGAATVALLTDTADIDAGTCSLSITTPTTLDGLTFGAVGISVSGADVADGTLCYAYLAASVVPFGFPVIDGAGQVGTPQILSAGLTLTVSLNVPGATTGTGALTVAWIS